MIKKVILLLTVSCMLTSCTSQRHVQEDAQGMVVSTVATPTVSAATAATPTPKAVTPTPKTATPTPEAAAPTPDASTPTPSPAAVCGSGDTYPGTGNTHVILVDFAQGPSAYFAASDGWSNGSVFNCTWRVDNVSFADSVMSLSIDTDGAASPPYSGGEYWSQDFYGYGRYEVSMKPITNNGVVSSFFTYTGPDDNNPWDEIDIEFLGKDTTVVEFNYYTNGNGSHEYTYDLGFDASADFHTYGFDWAEGSITWYVDGVAVYTATENIPVTPGRVMMNVWPGIDVDDWLNAYDGTVPLYAAYQWVRITLPD